MKLSSKISKYLNRNLFKKKACKYQINTRKYGQERNTNECFSGNPLHQQMSFHRESSAKHRGKSGATETMSTGAYTSAESGKHYTDTQTHTHTCVCHISSLLYIIDLICVSSWKKSFAFYVCDHCFI